MSALATAPQAAPRAGARRILEDTFVMMRRPLLRYRRDPQTAVFLFIQPIMFVLLFRYVFGGSIDIPGMSYVNFLIPGIIAQSVTFNVIGTSIGIAEDLSKGIIDRLRSLPMSGISVLAGRVLADAIVTTLTVLFMTAVGYLVGFRITTGVVPALLALLVLVMFGIAFSWVAALIGVKIGSVEAAQSAGFVWLFPLNFVSSVFVRPDTLPAPMEAFAEVNPITLVVDVVRGLTVGGDVAGSLPGALAWMVGLTLVFSWLTGRAWKSLG